jgi:hypothetical protein
VPPFFIATLIAVLLNAVMPSVIIPIVAAPARRLLLLKNYFSTIKFELGPAL